LVGHPHRRRADSAHARCAAQEPARRLCQRPQLVEGAVPMTCPPYRRAASAALLVSAAALASCATSSAKPPAIIYDDPPREIAATPAAQPPRAVEVVTIPEPLPLPGQLKPVTSGAATSEPADPRRRVGAANAAARIQPTRDGYVN